MITEKYPTLFLARMLQVCDNAETKKGVRSAVELELKALQKLEAIELTDFEKIAEELTEFVVFERQIN